MNRYITLLRGINVAGKNKLVMADLKAAVSELGFSTVATYLNSGNLILSSDITDPTEISAQIKAMISRNFKVDIPVYTLLQADLEAILAHAPVWWGDSDKTIYDNLIFVLPPLSPTDIHDEIGLPQPDYEKVADYENAIFWSFSRKDYQKTNWWSKTANSAVKDGLTIRTANTVRRLAKA